MPLCWCTNFINSGQSLQETDRNSLRTYMVQQEIQTDAYRKKSRDQNKSKQQTKNPNANASSNNRFSKRQSSKKEGSNNNEKKRKLDNEDDCPIHGASHKWGMCHQNWFGNNFKLKRTSASGSSSNQSQSRSHRSSFFNGLPRQVQVAGNDNPNPSSESSKTRSQTSNSTNWSFRYPNDYPNQHNNNNNNSNYYQGQFVVESYLQDNDNHVNHLPEGSILIKELNGIPVDPFWSLLFWLWEYLYSYQ